MPGSVAVAAPAIVLPQSLCTAFAHSRQYAIRANDYRDGSSQRGLLVGSSRKHWQLSKRLTAALLVELRDFYDARGGSLEAFWFYDWSTAPKFSYDPTGVSTDGRFTVHFVGDWSQSVGLGRGDCSIELEELA